MVATDPRRRLWRRAPGRHDMILVFGGNGQLGQSLVQAATSRSLPLRVLAHAEVDIADEAAVAAALMRWRPTLVVNAAAYTRVDLAESEADAAARTNEIAAGLLGSACARADIAMIHVSTDYVFDGTKAEAYLESDPVSPLNVYGRTKAAGEAALRRTLKHHVIIRTAWVYSEFGQNFLKAMLRLIQTRDELRVVDDQHGTPTSARDIAEAIVFIAPQVLREEEVWGTYHFTAGGATTWHGFARRIAAQQAAFTGRHPRILPISTAEYPTAAKRPFNSRLDCRLFARTFGFSANHWTESVDATVKTLLTTSKGVSHKVA
jgi:dTDP-4-dehydrorhamnose reductase